MTPITQRVGRGRVESFTRPRAHKSVCCGRRPAMISLPSASFSRPSLWHSRYARRRRAGAPLRRPWDSSTRKPTRSRGSSAPGSSSRLRCLVRACAPPGPGGGSPHASGSCFRHLALQQHHRSALLRLRHFPPALGAPDGEALFGRAFRACAHPHRSAGSRARGRLLDWVFVSRRSASPPELSRT